MNVGTPDAPTVPAVKSYLTEFLLDPDVIDIPAPLRELLVRGFILNTRPSKIAPRYASIWMDQGSPLRVYTQRIRDALGANLSSTEVEMGMRYGNPSVRSALERLRAKGVTDVLLAPLFPQFAEATVGTSLLQARKELDAMGWSPRVRTLGDFPTAPEFIVPLAASIRPHLGPKDHLLFSYHGLPVSQIEKARKANKKCYAQQCTMTTMAVVEALGLPEDRWSMSYQSRLGPLEWLSPATPDKIQELAARGVERLVVVSPAFVADGLETLEELAVEARDDFLKAGGKELVVVPCLNDDAGWIRGLHSLIKKGFAQPIDRGQTEYKGMDALLEVMKRRWLGAR
jgi:ferrochelatase